VRSVIPPGRDLCCNGGGDGLMGIERVVGMTGAPHDGQNSLSAGNSAPHFSQNATYSTDIEYQ
jgi:hypothetical protein